MSEAIFYLGPNTLTKHAAVNTYSNMHPYMYSFSTLDLHLNFGEFKFRDYSENGYMETSFRCFVDIIHTLIHKKKKVIIRDWYFTYANLDFIMNAFEKVTLRVFDTPIESYIKHYNEGSPWHKKLPDILDEIYFYDQFSTFIKSDLVERMKKDKNRITVIGLPMPRSVYD